MLSLLRTISLRYLLRRWSRAALVVISIALGVATLVSTRALNQTMGQATQGAISPFLDGTDLLVGNGQCGVPNAMADEIRAAGIEGVRQVIPLVFGRVLVPELAADDRRGRTVFLLGAPLDAGGSTDAPRDLHIDWTMSPGDLVRLAFRGQRPAVIGDQLVDRLGSKVESFRAQLAGHEVKLVSVGTVRLEGDTAALGREVLFMTRQDAAKLIYPLRPDYVTRINLVLDPEADREAVRQRVRELVGDRAAVLTTHELHLVAGDVTAGLEQGVIMLGLAALVIGLFLVYNTLSVSVAERRGDIGILRSTGATRGQIVGLFVGEASALGLTGALLGVPLGLGLAQLALLFLKLLFDEVFGLPLESHTLSVAPSTVALCLAAGVLTAVIASVVPALRAALEDPAHAVRGAPVTSGPTFFIALAAVTALLVTAAVLCVWYRSHLPTRWGAYAAIALMLLASLVGTPLLASLFGRLIQPFFRFFLGLAGRLAADNLVRSPVRTGLVVAALAATASLLVSTAGFIHSTERELIAWVDEQVAADLFVTAGASFDKAGLAIPMSEGLGQKLAAMPEVEVALPIRGHILEFRHKVVVLLSVDMHAFDATDGRYALGRNFGRFPRLSEPGTALVSDNFAALYGVKVGDRVKFRGPSGPLEVEVIGTAPDYTWNRGTILVDRAWFRDRFADDQVDIYDVWLRPGADPLAVREKVLALGASEAAAVRTRAELRRDLSLILHRVYALAYALEVVVGLVALLGVTNALLISVLQRRRELGLLRAVGATRSQVLRSVLAEATLMGLLGGLIGFAIGLLLEWFTLRVLISDDAGWLFPLAVPWKAAGIVIGSTLVLATLAGLVPALQAVRLRIAEAVAHE
jgi:putative ABC transport system permease protein